MKLAVALLLSGTVLAYFGFVHFRAEVLQEGAVRLALRIASGVMLYAGIKAAYVELIELHLEGLGGKGHLIFGGEVAEVEAAIVAGSATAQDRLEASVVIPQAHPEMRENLLAHDRFESRVRGE